MSVVRSAVGVIAALVLTLGCGGETALFSVEDDDGNLLSAPRKCGVVSCDAAVRARGREANCDEARESARRYFWVLVPGGQLSGFSPSASHSARASPSRVVPVPPWIAGARTARNAFPEEPEFA